MLVHLTSWTSFNWFICVGKLVILCLFSLCLAHCICIACKFIWHLWQSWFGKWIFRQKVKILISWFELLHISWISDFTWICFRIIHNIWHVCVFPYFPLNLARELVSHIHRLTCLPTYKVVLRDDSGNLLEKLTSSVCLCLAESKYSKNKEEELLICPRICRN